MFSLCSLLGSYYIPLKLLLLYLVPRDTFFARYFCFSCCFLMCFLALSTSSYLHNPLKSRTFNLRLHCVRSKSWWVDWKLQSCVVGKVEHRAVWTRRKRHSSKL